MASTEQLIRIAGLTERLDGLDEKRPGMPIEADEWNDLIGVLRGVLELDRRQEEGLEDRQSERFAERLHEHLGQVRLSWLDAELRGAVGKGGNGIETHTALNDMRARLEGLGVQTAKLTELVERLVKLTDDLEVRDLDRTRRIRVIDERFAGIEGLQNAVTSLSQQVMGFRDRIEETIELRNSLKDAQGRTIDVARLSQQVASLSELSDNLRGVDGKILRMRDIELRLNEIADAAGVGGAGGLVARLSEASAALEERLNNRIERRFEDGLAGLKGSLTEDLVTRTGAVREALQQDLRQRFSDESKALRTDAIGSARELVSREGQSIREETQASLGTARTQIENTLRQQLVSQLASELDSRVQDADARLTSRFDELEGDVESFRTDIRQQLEKQAADAALAAVSAVESKLRRRFEELSEGLGAQISRAAQAAIEAATPEMEERINGVVDARLRDVDQRIDASLDRSLGDLNDRIRQEIRLQIDNLDLDTRMRAIGTDVRNELRAELRTSLAEQRANSAGALDAAVEGIRSEINAAVESGVENAVGKTGGLVRELRNELSARLSSQVQNLEAAFDGKLREMTEAMNKAFRRINPNIVIRRPGQGGRPIG